MQHIGLSFHKKNKLHSRATGKLTKSSLKGENSR